jgi:hypothetical protein
VQGLWETNFCRNWTYGLVFIIGNVKNAIQTILNSERLTLRQKIPELPQQGWAVEEGQSFDSLTTGSLLWISGTPSWVALCFTWDHLIRLAWDHEVPGHSLTWL